MAIYFHNSNKVIGLCAKCLNTHKAFVMKNIYIKESHNELGAKILKEWERDKQGVLEKWVKERQ